MSIIIQSEVKNLLGSFLAKGYRFNSFESGCWFENQREIILRYDIDFDCDVALAFARMEARIVFRATYYFLLCSKAYNLISTHNIKIVQEIQKLRHHISLHFDPVDHENPSTACQKQLNIFPEVFYYHPKFVSIHRPAQQYLGEKSCEYARLYGAKLYSLLGIYTAKIGCKVTTKIAKY